MSYSIQNKLCDDVLGIVKSFRGKTYKEKLFSHCLEDILNNPELIKYLRKDETAKHVYKVMRINRRYIQDGYSMINGKKKINYSIYLLPEEGTQRGGFYYPPFDYYKDLIDIMELRKREIFYKKV